jgi:hypothetical protein
MRSHALTAGVLGAIALGGVMWTAQGAPAAAGAPGPNTIEGPFTHDNLAVYVIRGGSGDLSAGARSAKVDDRAYLTLGQGLAAGTVQVREKGAAAGQDRATVNSLEIENKSDRWLFLHAGDIVKGGKQDRTIMTDVLLPPHSKPQDIDAFCVEHGRWTPSRDGLAFKANPGIVAGSALKRAIQGEKNQQRVWQEVASAEGRAVTVARAAEPVAAPAMPMAQARLSSTGTYNAIAEHNSLNAGRAAYVAALLPSVRKFKDAVGLAVAINGKMAAADVYASPGLFDALSGKLLESFALEALLAKGNAQSAPPAKQQVTAFIAAASAVPAANETVGQSMQRSTRETRDTVVYEYTHVTVVGTRRDAQVLHKSYLKK